MQPKVFSLHFDISALDPDNKDHRYELRAGIAVLAEIARHLDLVLDGCTFCDQHSPPGESPQLCPFCSCEIYPCDCFKLGDN